MTRPTPLSSQQLVARAGYVLRSNSAGTMTRAAPDLYPHQWSWDAAFIAVGLAHVDVPRACAELDTLFAGQWRTGMVPHIVFDDRKTGYFPGPDRWATAELNPDAPVAPRTSGLCQPPVHALAVERIEQVAADRGGAAVATVSRWLPRVYDRLLAWHRYLAHRRDPTASGLLRIYHGWESGMDNSPRWDDVYGRIRVGPDLPAYQRRDITVVSDASQRPTDAEYDRYLWIVEQLKRAGYDDSRVQETGAFLATDVFASAVFAAANRALERLAERLGKAHGPELQQYANRFRRGVVASVDPLAGLALDTDLRSGDRLDVRTLAGFAPLVCGGLGPAQQRRMVELLESSDWTGNEQLRWPVLPSTSPTSPDFRSRAYWRGPSWPVMNWFFVWALAARGERGAAARLRRAALDQLADGSLAEYYEPVTGEGLGSVDQSWTAAAVLDLVG
ncbi:MAG: glycogen debranching protein [Actinomycetota bacterium]|nr:glycogen debranching protein [Actinomycetota bacterium]